MSDAKWFYPIQKNVSDRLREDFDRKTVLFQDVLHDRVYESYECFNTDRAELAWFLAVMNRRSGRFSLYKLIER